MILETGEVEFSYTRKQDPETSSRETVLQDSLDRLETKELRIREAYEGGIDTLEEFKRNKERLKKERNRLQEELEALKQAAPEPDQAQNRKVLLEKILNSSTTFCSPRTCRWKPGETPSAGLPENRIRRKGKIHGIPLLCMSPKSLDLCGFGPYHMFLQSGPPYWLMISFASPALGSLIFTGY